MPDLNQRGLNSQTILRETIIPRIDITTSDGATVEVTKVPLSTGDRVVEVVVQGGGGGGGDITEIDGGEI